MSKVDIDILVGLGLYGPAEAGEAWWPFHERHGPTGTEPPLEVATALGAMLWQANADMVFDPEDDEYEPLPEYTFERVPFPVTAVEGSNSSAATSTRPRVRTGLDRRQRSFAAGC